MEQTSRQIMKGARTFDSMKCKQDLEMWHQQLDHVDYENLERIVRYDAIQGLPKIDGDCMNGKQH